MSNEKRKIGNYEVIACQRIGGEEIIVGEDKNANYLSGKVQYSTFLGLNTHYIVELEDGYRAEIIQESLIDDIIENGTVIRLGMKAEKINVFTSDGSESLVK